MAVQLSSLPVAAQMLLDPAVELGSSVLDAWQAACAAAASAQSSEECDAVLLAAARGHGAAALRREQRPHVDTADFFALAAALDTLAGELSGNGALGGPPPSTTTDAAAGAAAGAGTAAASRVLGVDELDSHDVDALVGAQREAAREAHQHFDLGNYAAALSSFQRVSSACLAHELTPALLHNMAVCHLLMEQWDACETATRRVLAAGAPGRHASARRLVRVCIAQGRVREAQELVGPNREAPDWAGEVAAVKAFAGYANLYAAHQYSKALESLETVLRLCPCGTLEATKARLLSLDNVVEAARYAAQQCRVYPASSELRLCAWDLAFHSATTADALDAVLADMQASGQGTADLRVRLLHSHITRSKEALATVQGLVAARRWADVVVAASQALAQPSVSDGLKGVFYVARARSLAEQASWYAALDDAHCALSHTDAATARASALLLIAGCEEALGRLRDAVHHTEESARLAPSAATTGRLNALRARVAAAGSAARAQARTAPKAAPPGQRQHADGAAPPPPPPRRGPPVDVHYNTLSLPRSATVMEVKKSYRALAMRWHPDRWCGAADEAVRTAEATFKAIQHAYEEIIKGTT
ncbi:chaperone protein DNAj [Novymonas esmeraldas]|uniref:Chaperone protein DNAj n=1 Tax=Novymonas esmeraldas TaxID=1808958 RepID=A0AAW0EYH4_9TRYP